MSLHVHCHISGGHFLLDLFAKFRYYIFCKELPVVTFQMSTLYFIGFMYKKCWSLSLVFDRCWRLLCMEMWTCWTTILSCKKLLFMFISTPTSMSSTESSAGVLFGKLLHLMVTGLKLSLRNSAWMNAAVVSHLLARFRGLIVLATKVLIATLGLRERECLLLVQRNSIDFNQYIQLC